MEVRLESKEGPRVASPSACIDHFARQTGVRQTQWGSDWPTTPMRLPTSSRKSINTIGREQGIWWRLYWGRSLPNQPWPTM